MSKFRPSLRISEPTGYAYLKLTNKKVFRTVTFASSKFLYDYDKNDELVGIEFVNFKKLDLSILKPSILKNLVIKYDRK